MNQDLTRAVPMPMLRIGRFPFLNCDKAVETRHVTKRGHAAFNRSASAKSRGVEFERPTPRSQRRARALRTRIASCCRPTALEVACCRLLTYASIDCIFHGVQSDARCHSQES